MNENQKKIKDGHSLNNIRKDLADGQIVELENVELLYVWSEKEPFPLANEYAYSEVPGQAGNRYGVLCPVSCKPYVEQHVAMVDDDPTDPMTSKRGLWFVEMETVHRNLLLTRHEAARFKQDFDGQCDVMRNMKKPVKVFDDVEREWYDGRLGIFDVIKEASGDFTGMTIERIGEQKFPKGSHRGKRMKELDLDYVVRGSIAGGLGLRDNQIQSMCKKELIRRETERKLAETVTDPEPTENKQSIHYCAGKTKANKDCSQPVKNDGDFCRQHAPKEVTVDG